MSEKKLAYDFWNTPEGIRSQKIFDMRDRIRRLEASNAELLEALKDCCVIAKPENPDCCCPAFAGWRLRGSKKTGIAIFGKQSKKKGGKG